jgi:hypothetical protein
MKRCLVEERSLSLVLAAVLVFGGALENGLAQQSFLLRASAGGTNSPVLLDSTPHPGSVLSLEASTNLAHWTALGIFHDAIRAYPDFTTPAWPARFYRASRAPRVPADNWKNQIIHPEDPFRFDDGFGRMQWVKFALLLAEPNRVYYQDSAAYPFHYDFAVARLEPFRGMTPRDFDAISLYRTNQQVVLGAVLIPPTGGTVEYGVQFVGRDLFTPEEIARWYALVKATVYSSNGAGVYYVPTYEQSEVARTNQAAFDALGIQVASVERWIPGDHCYARGWALGRLKYFPAAEIAAAFADGRLRSEDILLTDGVPAETPAVAGIITLRPSTPNSHTAILARSFGIPFVFFPAPADQERLATLVGRQIILRAVLTPWGAAELALFDVEGALTPEAEAQLLDTRKPPPIQYVAKQPLGAFSAPTDALTPSDIRFFGGKAANYGFLRRAIPDQSPPAIAFSFDLWDAFLDQVLPGQGRTLREEIAARLGPYTNYPTDIPSLKQTLSGIRTLIRQSASFSPAQQQTITNALTPFNAQRKIRFRSSTNVEDAEHFTGAGLYDSYSGCLLDDADDDTTGPSHCDPTETGERGVYRAIQRVYASFYNDNAFLERLRHGVKESEVGMGVLVHHSFPDEDELANGVATLDWSFSANWTQAAGELVTQQGAVSVTNPDGSSIPEVVKAESFNTWRSLTLTRYSSLLPLGARVMAWESDYHAFMDHFAAVAQAYRAHYPSKNRFVLDYEYKKDRHLGRVVKQVRELPRVTTTSPQQAFLINAPADLVLDQGEYGHVFANHRLKSFLRLETRNMWLVNSNLAQGIYTRGTFNYLENGTTGMLAGELSGWPNAAHSDDGRRQSWATGSGAGLRQWIMETEVQTQTSSGEPPIFSQNDFARYLSVKYEQPMPQYDAWEGETQVLTEGVRLGPPRLLTPGSIPVNRSFSTNGVSIVTSFYWPEPPTGPTAGYTAPLVTFVRTEIAGLTSEPINLTNYFSQTYRPQHHNFSEDFIFEPGLEPGLPAGIRAELEAANVKLIYLQVGFRPTAMVLGFDGKFRSL